MALIMLTIPTCVAINYSTCKRYI